MSGYGDETAAITGLLESQWTDTPIEFPNTPLNPNGAAHVSVAIRRQTAFNASVNSENRRVRHPGLLVLTVRVPQGTGDGTAIDYGDQLADLFRNISLEPGMHFRAPTVRPLGPDGKGFYVVQVECPFYRDSIH